MQLGKNCDEFSSGRRKLKLQICVSSDEKSTESKKPSKDGDTGVTRSRPNYPPSTNISSPVQAASRSRTVPRLKAKASRYEYVEDDFVDDDSEEAFEEPRYTRTPQRKTARYFTDSHKDSDDEFESVREAGRPRRSKKRDIGPPITIDEKLASLNPIHRGVVENFLFEAQKESDKVGASCLLPVLKTFPLTKSRL